MELLMCGVCGGSLLCRHERSQSVSIADWNTRQRACVKK